MLLGPETVAVVIVVVVAGVVVDAGMVVFVVDDDDDHGEVVGIIGCVVVVGVEDGVEDGVVVVLVDSFFGVGDGEGDILNGE